MADEQSVEELAAGISAVRVRRLDYEDLDEAALKTTAEWLWAAAGGPPPNVALERDFLMPKKFDQGEALALKRLFLEHIGAS
jgi:hypothetical protein